MHLGALGGDEAILFKGSMRKEGKYSLMSNYDVREAVKMKLYSQFKSYFGNSSFSTDLLLYIQESKLEDEIVAFYPKNWFHKDKTPEIFLFTKSDIVWIKKNYKTLEVDIYKDYKVTKLSYFEHLNDRYAGSRIEIFLQSGDRIKLDASEDVNPNYEDWVVSLSQYIREIYNLLK